MAGASYHLSSLTATKMACADSISLCEASGLNNAHASLQDFIELALRTQTLGPWRVSIMLSLFPRAASDR
jgi:hypothetical protein